jgi:quercetin dioxygenase-like cupin family protein
VARARRRRAADPHPHAREDETLYVLDGSITAVVGDQRIDVEAGSYAALPKNVPHGLTVRGDEARLLITLEPAGAEYFLVPRDAADGDADPNRFGIVLHESAPAM